MFYSPMSVLQIFTEHCQCQVVFRCLKIMWINKILVLGERGTTQNVVISAIKKNKVGQRINGWEYICWWIWLQYLSSAKIWRKCSKKKQFQMQRSSTRTALISGDGANVTGIEEAKRNAKQNQRSRLTSLRKELRFHYLIVKFLEGVQPRD